MTYFLGLLDSVIHGQGPRHCILPGEPLPAGARQEWTPGVMAGASEESRSLAGVKCQLLPDPLPSSPDCDRDEANGNEVQESGDSSFTI